jgi:hypothetical protein
VLDHPLHVQHDGVIRDDDTLPMARYVWTLVHGLGIDDRLPERGAVEDLMRYGFERLRTGIAVNPDRSRARIDAVVERYGTTRPVWVHYSREHRFGATAREQWAAPDLVPLPF